MKFMRLIILNLFVLYHFTTAQSVSFETYVNPVIPGDHPDPTLTKIGNHFYTSGSSFNPTPKIYHSTDLVHWEVIAQPVSASWVQYNDNPGDGIWGGHMVFYNGLYWHYFGRGGETGGGIMYFVTAEQPQGPWSDPVQVQNPPGLFGLGVDNSLFIDEDNGKWYLLTKAGHENNHIVELGPDGQPTGIVLDLTWLNPNAEGNPYGWAEGPVMWKYKGYYYYSFAEHLVGQQYVMRSDTLTDDKSYWTIIGSNIFKGTPATFNRPNHISPAVMLDDSSSWIIAHSYHSSSNWYAHGRQGLLCQVTYDEEGFPSIQYPPNTAVKAPHLPHNGIPWMVPKSDTFDGTTLHPRWSLLGYTSAATHSLDVIPGWLYLEPYGGFNTIIQNDGEHNYSLITRVDFEPQSTADEAGLQIINGPETHRVKIFSTRSGVGQNSVAFGFGETQYQVENDNGTIVWLKLVRDDHLMSGFFSADGKIWTQVGEEINALALDTEQSQFNDFTGNQQGLYVQGNNYAFFDLYIYRDAYTPINAKSPVNYFGVVPGTSSLANIDDNEWALYAGVEFGNDDYMKHPDSIEIYASCGTTGGTVEVWLDSIDNGKKIAECTIGNSGGWTDYKTYRAAVDSVSGRHDVYLRFLGPGSERLFQIRWFRFLSEYDISTGLDPAVVESPVPAKFQLHQNFPNPFNPNTTIQFMQPVAGKVELKLYNQLGEQITTIASGDYSAGTHRIDFYAGNLASGIYYYRFKAGIYSEMKKMILLK